MRLFGAIFHEIQYAEKPRLPEIELWAAVLWVAVCDACTNNKNAKQTIAWFATKNREPGGFDWICEALGLDNVEQIRKLMMDSDKRIVITRKISWNKLSSSQAYKSKIFRKPNKILAWH